MNEENRNNEEHEQNPLKGFIYLILLIVIIGGCMANGANNSTNDFDWNDPDDVGGFLEYLNRDK